MHKKRFFIEALFFIMKKLLSVFITLFFFIHSHAQKKIERSYIATELTGISIHSDQIFEIHITTHTRPEILLSAQIDGEIYAETLLKSKIEDHTLQITTGLTPDFKDFNDKLAAHKVISIVLHLTIPEDTDVNINSVLAQVHLEGQYGRLQFKLGRGGIEGRGLRFRESDLHTIAGAVHLVLAKASVQAYSRNGTVFIADLLPQGPFINIRSIHGNIEVLQLQ